MAPNAHSRLSPSSAHRWMACTPSVMLEAQFEDTESEAAREGTVAHALGESKLNLALGRKSERPVSDYICDEMEEATDGYAAFVMEKVAEAKVFCKDPLIMIEKKVDLSEYAPESFGTADCCIVSDHVMHIVDLKYGQGIVVSAEGNPQMLMYASGFLKMFESIYDIDEVFLSIYQPRRENFSTWQISASELKHWAECELKPKALMAYEGEGEFKAGSHCQFCKASAVCRARAEENLRLAKYEFRQANLLTPSEIADILRQADELTSWANEIKAYALNEATSHGVHFEGFKLVEGSSVRKYSDEAAVAKAAEDAGFTDIYKKTLITLTSMESLMGKSKFQEVLGHLITRPAGKPTLVPASDKRPELVIGDAKTEFRHEV